MKFKVLLSWVITLVCAALILVSCGGLRVHSMWGWGHGQGLSMDGYRHKHKEEGLMYDSSRGLSIIIGSPAYYYHKGHYYRFRKPRWEKSISTKGPWESVSAEALPQGLQTK